jgi:hypothetical protein
LVVVAVACSGSDHSTPWSGVHGDRPLSPNTVPCRDGETRECHQTLSERAGTLTCAIGTETCEAGKFGDCAIETLTEQAAPSWYGNGALRAQAAPVACNPVNPCDPSCQQYGDTPDAGLEPIEDKVIESEWDWQWGSLADFPGGLVKKGMIEPCHTAQDCQFDMYCRAPDSGSCSHDMCDTGSALAAGCDASDTSRSCVQKVCDVDETCCTQASPQACGHSLCAAGTKLKNGCGANSVEAACSKAVCDAKPSCCSGSWDASCVQAVNTYCKPLSLAECTCGTDELTRTVSGQTSCYYLDNSINKSWANARSYCETTRPGDLSIVIINDASENAYLQSQLAGDAWIGAWSKKISGNWVWVLPDGVTTVPFTDWYPPTPAAGSGKAAWIKRADGKWWSDIDTNTRGIACEGPPSKYKQIGSVTTHTWSQSCVDKVESVCGAVCDTDAADTGTCQQYPAGYVDPDCTTLNLTVAPTCERDGTTVVPVCNHGAGTAPAGIRIISFQGNSKHFPAVSPTTSTSDVKDTCFTTEEIPPGSCIEVLGCELDTNGEVVVNPHTAGLTSPTPVTECNAADNWTLVHPNSECGSPTCGTADGFYDGFTNGSCKQAIPDQTYGDPGLVSIRHVYDDGNASTTDEPYAFSYVNSAASCGSALGWYYDNPSNPSEFILCPEACERVESSTYSASTVHVQLACQSSAVYEETSYLFAYSGDCGFDRGVQWSDLGYEAAIPSDSSIELRFAVAGSEAELPDEDKFASGWSSPVAVDSSIASCPLNSSCMVDVFEALGGLPDARLPYLGILITVIPSTDNQAPSLNDWDLRYSCPFNQ